VHSVKLVSSMTMVLLKRKLFGLASSKINLVRELFSA
jgi:hypothetical protein